MLPRLLSSCPLFRPFYSKFSWSTDLSPTARFAVAPLEKPQQAAPPRPNLETYYAPDVSLCRLISCRNRIKSLPTSFSPNPSPFPPYPPPSLSLCLSLLFSSLWAASLLPVPLQHAGDAFEKPRRTKPRRDAVTTCEAISPGFLVSQFKWFISQFCGETIRSYFPDYDRGPSWEILPSPLALPLPPSSSVSRFNFANKTFIPNPLNYTPTCYTFNTSCSVNSSWSSEHRKFRKKHKQKVFFEYETIY